MTLDLLAGDLYHMQDLLDPEEQKILQRVREFLRAEVAPIANDCWARAEFPYDLIPGYAELGIAGLNYDECPGDRPSSLLSGFLSMEMAHTDASMATFFGVHVGLAMGSISQCGSAEQRLRWLPAMARMNKIGAFALTEPDGGSDVALGLRTTARREGREWVLDGAKRWIGNGTFADLIVVWAKDVEDDKVKGFVLEKGTPGLSTTKIENKIALRTVQNADITLTGCRVPEADRLENARGFRDTAGILRRTRSGVAWQSVGVMLAAYEIARDYAVTREQFGRPIGGFQLVQDLLVKMLGNATASEALYSYEGTREINTLIVGRAVTGLSTFV